MKKLFLIGVAFTAVTFTLTSCLKDKGFENGTYGINDPDTQPPGVGFPYGATDRTDFGLDVATTTQAVGDIIVVNLETGVAAKSDVHVTLTNNTTTMIAAYNTANGLTGTDQVLPLPASLFTVPLAVTVPAGSHFGQIHLDVSNTTTLDASRLYAVGLTISAVDGGYTIAENLKNLFIVFSIKNQYDGKYTLRGKFFHNTATNPPTNFTTNVEMRTVGPNSVKIYWPLAGAFANPMWYSGALNYFGVQEPEFTVNPSTNKVVVTNTAPGAVTPYVMCLGFNNAGYDHRWDPASKTFFVCFGYNLGAGGSFPGLASTARVWEDTLIRTGPR